MSSAYKGHWLNGSKETGFTAEAFKGPNAGKVLLASNGKVLNAPMADIKRAIVSPAAQYTTPA